MHGEISHELEVKVPASEVWEVYGTIKLANLLAKLLPAYVQKVEILEGDGGVGTILKITFPPGTPGFTSYKEKFTKIDDEKRLKEVDLIEGAFLDLGFSFYQVRIEIIEKEANSSIIKSTVLYELNEEFASNASLITTERLEAIAQVFGKYLTEKNANACNS